MKVLSYCDGIATGYHAVKRLWPDEYLHYEAVEKNSDARYVADLNSNFCIKRRVNDVYKFVLADDDDFDLFLCGFTCSSLTVQGKRQGFKGESRIIFKCVQDLKKLLKINPKAKFLIENVASMSNSDRIFLDKLIGVESVLINSGKVSGQARRRLYWCNFKISEIKDRNISANSCLDSDGAQLMAWSRSTRYKDTRTGRIYSSPGEFRESYVEQRYRKDDKANTLVTGIGCQGPSTRNTVIRKNGFERMLSLNECKKLQTLPDDFSFGKISTNKSYKMIGLGWNLETIIEILRGIK